MPYINSSIQQALQMVGRPPHEAVGTPSAMRGPEQYKHQLLLISKNLYNAS